MQPSDTSLTIRIARPSDLQAVARLCRRTVGPGDYVLKILREVILGKGLFLAWDKDQLAGITHFAPCIDGSGWLSMARTDPEWQRHGVALALQSHIAGYARRKKMKFLRLWVLSENKPSIMTCTRAGFKPICEAAHVSSNRRLKRNSGQAPLPNPMKTTLLESMFKSPYVAKMNGYFAYKRHFVKMSKDLLSTLVRKRELYWDGESAFILTNRK
jgi:GNAT superfamily N-acetyltransferase